jgi:hypothetical protein
MKSLLRKRIQRDIRDTKANTELSRLFEWTGEGDTFLEGRDKESGDSILIEYPKEWPWLRPIIHYSKLPEVKHEWNPSLPTWAYLLYLVTMPS